MGSVRWAFPCGAWRPRRREWLLAAQLVQPEEKERIGQFVFARDAKAALVHGEPGRGCLSAESAVPKFLICGKTCRVRAFQGCKAKG